MQRANSCAKLYQTLTPVSRLNAHLDKSHGRSSTRISGVRKLRSVIYDNEFRASSEFVISAVFARIYGDKQSRLRSYQLVFIA